jgi:mRNA interferase HicA
MKRRDFLRHLTSHGCEILREGAKHSWWHNPSLGKRSAVPRHTELNNHLARKICHDPGVPTPEKF